MKIANFINSSNNKMGKRDSKRVKKLNISGFTTLFILLISMSSSVFAQKKSAPMDVGDFTKLDIQTNGLVADAPFVFNGEAGQTLIYREESKHLNRLVVNEVEKGDPQKKRAASIRKMLSLPILDTYIQYDVGGCANHEACAFFITKSGVDVVSAKSGKLKQRVKIESIFSGAKSGFHGHLKFTQDINQDGLSDMVITQIDRISMLIQQSNGEFRDVHVNVTPQSHILNNTISLEHNNPSSVSFNQSSLPAFELDAKMLVVSLEANDEAPFSTLTYYAPLSDNVKRSDRTRFTNQKSTSSTTRILAIEDFNGDGISDLLSLEEKKDGMFSSANSLKLFLGKDTEGRWQVSDIALTTLKFSGGLVNLGLDQSVLLIDLNNDGRKEVIFGTTEIGVGNIISSLFSQSAEVNVRAYSLNNNNQFTSKAIFKTSIDLSFDMDSETLSMPLVNVIDSKGDGKFDMIIQTDEDEVTIYEELFSRKSKRKRRKTEILLPLPNNGFLVTIDDYNSDKKSDFIFRYDMSDKNANKLTMWLSK